jgi:hypothetical protein
MNIKKLIGLLICLVILMQILLIPAFTSDAKADTRVMITFTAGGVACGAYFFLHFIFRSSMTMQPYQYDTAVLNHDAEGWKVGFPALNRIQSEHSDRLFPQNVPETFQMNLLKIRF